MALHRRWLLILFALVLGGGQLFAASREDRAYSAAVQAFDDRLYPLAETRLTQFVQTYRKSTNAPAAVLLLAQADYYLKNYPAVTNRLGDPVNFAKAKAAGLADQYVYWQAEALFAHGDLENAAQTFISLSADFPNSPVALNAVVEAAAAYGKLGEWPKADSLLESTNGLFQRMAELDPGSEQVANGRLLQSESKYVQRRFTEAVQVLSSLNPSVLTPEQDWKRSYLLYRANLGMNDLDGALAAATNMLQTARSGHGDDWPANLAESVASHAGVLEQQGRLAEAAAALQENLSSAVPVEEQQRAILKMAELAMAQKNLANAEAGLEAFVTQFPDSAATEVALLTLGELHLKDYVAQPSASNQLAMATAKLNQFLASSTNSPLAGKAFLARGWCHWLAGEYADGLTDFGAAAKLLPVSEDLAVARFKMGDSQFALNDFAGAQTNYQAVLTDFPALPQIADSLDGRALYQILRARLVLHDVGGVDDVMRQLLGKFLTNAPPESSVLLAGQGFSEFNSPSRARELFLEFEAERTNSPLLPEVAFALGRTYEREQNWQAAATNDQAWLKAYPTDELRPQVEYARAWAVAQTGDETAAFGLFTNFPSRYPTSPLTPLVDWWVGDHYFRQGTYPLAELNYETIFQNFPTNDLAYPAQLMAGRAALGRSQPSDAKKYFYTVLMDTNCPDDLRDQARFGYCEALWALAPSDTNNASLVEATNVLEEMIPKADTNIVGAMAWSKTGDCDLQLGALDAATNAYAQVLSSPSASQELRNQAEVGLGIVLEKKAESLPPEAQRPLLSLALNSYTDVLYTTNLVGDAFWTKKAGLQALPLMMTLKEGDANKFFDTLERWLPPLKDTLEKKRAALAD